MNHFVRSILAAVVIGGVALAPVAEASTTLPGLAATASVVWGGLSPDYGALDNLTSQTISVAVALPITTNAGSGSSSTGTVFKPIIGGKSANVFQGISCAAFSQTQTGAGNAFQVTNNGFPAQSGVNTTFALGSITVPPSGSLFVACSIDPGSQLLSITY
jgi:hypothetical protein